MSEIVFVAVVDSSAVDIPLPATLCSTVLVAFHHSTSTKAKGVHRFRITVYTADVSLKRCLNAEVDFIVAAFDSLARRFAFFFIINSPGTYTSTATHTGNSRAYAAVM